MLPRTDPPPTVGDLVADRLEVDHHRVDGGVQVEHEPSVAGAAEAATAAASTAVEGRDLTERELAVLALERRRYRHPGAKEQAVRDELDLSATRYYQLLNSLLDEPAALAHDPVLVGRLRRLRDARAAERPSS